MLLEPVNKKLVDPAAPIFERMQSLILLDKDGSKRGPRERSVPDRPVILNAERGDVVVFLSRRWPKSAVGGGVEVPNESLAGLLP